MTITKNSKFLPYLALAAVCILWGTTYLALRIGVLAFPAFLFSALRQVLAGGLLVSILVLAFKIKLPKRDAMLTQAIGGFFLITIGNGLVGWAELVVPSGVAAIICSIMPVWLILINMIVAQDERPTFPIILGLIIGLSGIVIIFGEHIADFSRPEYIFGIVTIFVANIGWALGSVWMKRKNHSSNAFMNAGLQMFFGGLYLVPISLIFDDYTHLQWSGEAVYSLIYLIIFGSIAAYTAYSYALKKLPITIVSLYAYVNPIVAVVLGWLVLGEKLNAQVWIAIAITIAGIYIVNKGYQLRNIWKAQFTSDKI